MKNSGKAEKAIIKHVRLKRNYLKAQVKTDLALISICYTFVFKDKVKGFGGHGQQDPGSSQ